MPNNSDLFRYLAQSMQETREIVARNTMQRFVFEDMGIATSNLPTDLDFLSGYVLATARRTHACRINYFNDDSVGERKLMLACGNGVIIYKAPAPEQINRDLEVKQLNQFRIQAALHYIKWRKQNYKGFVHQNPKSLLNVKR